MATRTTYYELIKPSQTDLVDVRDLNTNFDNIDAIMHTNEVNIDSLDGRMTTAESDIDDLQEATEHLSDGDTVYPYASEIEIEDALGVNAKDVKVKITAVQSGSGTPSPQNVRPIIGFDECNIQRLGKNKLGSQARLTKTASQGVTFTPVYDNADNLMYIDVTGTSNGTNTDYYLFGASGVYVSAGIPTGDYIMSDGLDSGAGTKIGIIVIKSNGTIVKQTKNDHANTPIEFDSSETYRITIRCYDANTSYNYRIYPMVRLSTETDPTYEPYKGKTYTIQLGDTIYVGVIDVTTGVMTVTHKSVNLNGSETWYKSNLTSCDIYMTTIDGSDFDEEYLTNLYQATPTQDKNSIGWSWRGSSSSQVRFGYATYNTTTVEDFKSWLANNNIQVCYALATPFTIQLTPEQIQLLVGYNYLTANTGDIQVTTTDVKGAIEQADKLIEANTQAIREIDSLNDSIFGTVENGTTASKAYAQGDYFVKGKKIAKALADIAKNATFTLDTNYELTDICEKLVDCDGDWVVVLEGQVSPPGSSGSAKQVSIDYTTGFNFKLQTSSPVTGVNLTVTANSVQIEMTPTEKTYFRLLARIKTLYETPLTIS